MAVNTDVIGKTYAPRSYVVGREKVREFAAAVGESNPLHFDVEAACAAGYEDVVAPPMFVVVYGMQAVIEALFDPEVGANFARLVHGGQEFQWGPLVVAGDEITTVASVADISERAGNEYFVFRSESENQRGEIVSVGTWTNIVRAGG
jgi:acyl dehydratase